MKKLNRLALTAPILSVLLVISGCKNTTKNPERWELRHKLFIECMDLSAKITRSGDDDVSDIIDSCGSQSHNMAYQIM